MTANKKPKIYYSAKNGQIVLGDSQTYLNESVQPKSVDLIITSPPFGLVRKKSYGNADAGDYLEWFRPFAEAMKRVLKDTGSLVIDIGGAWIPGQPTRSLYHFKLLIMLCEEYGFHLAQEFYWWNPSKLPTPAEWVTVRRVRVKDAINCVWWLSPTSYPRADNRRVLQPYSESMMQLLKNGYKAMKRPSGHDISDKFSINNGAAIPPNLLALANTESNSYYLRYCKEHNITTHPARFPAEIPEFFIRLLTDPGDVVIDPFGGSCVTGEVAERLSRKWTCIDLVEDYVKGAIGRFKKPGGATQEKLCANKSQNETNYYKVPRPGLLWNGVASDPLPEDGGKQRRKKQEQTAEAQLSDEIAPASKRKAKKIVKEAGELAATKT